MGFDIFGMNVLTGRQNDNVLCSADNIQMTVGVEFAQIAAPKPTVFGKCILGRFRIFVISAENDRTANQHFSYAVLIRLIKLDLSAFHWLTNRTHYIVGFIGGRCGAAGFSKAVTL